MKLTVARRDHDIGQVVKILRRAKRHMGIDYEIVIHELGVDIDTETLNKMEIRYLIGMLESHDVVVGIIDESPDHGESAIDLLARKST